MQTALLHGLPLLVVIGLIALVYSRKGKGPATYTPDQPWTGAPILWAATDEVVHSGHGTGHHSEDALSVGGGASGRW